MKRLIIFLFFLGFIFRLWLINSVPQPLIYDQLEYLGFAKSILKEGIFLFTSRLYGYPIIIVPFLSFFGQSVKEAMQIFQALLDTGSGLLIFLIAGKLWPGSPVKWISYFLYLFNPFTSAYTGVLLTEVTAIFLLALVFYLYIVFWETKQVRYLIPLAFLLGFLPQVRPSFTIFTGLFLLILIFDFLRSAAGRHKLFNVFLILLFYILPFCYNVIGNWRQYRAFSPMLVDDAFVKELYISLYVDKALPKGIGGADWKIPPPVQKIWDEFSLPTDAAARKAMADKYRSLSLTKIKEDPGQFMKTRVIKMFTVWDKGYLFPYDNIPSKALVSAVFLMNITLLSLTVYGLLIAVIVNAGRRNPLINKFIMMTVILFIYISVFHTVSTTEDRFSLPAYPYLCLFASFVFILLKEKIIKRNSSSS